MNHFSENTLHVQDNLPGKTPQLFLCITDLFYFGFLVDLKFYIQNKIFTYCNLKIWRRRQIKYPSALVWVYFTAYNDKIFNNNLHFVYVSWFNHSSNHKISISGNYFWCNYNNFAICRIFVGGVKIFVTDSWLLFTN